jgi:hypothetical protein
MLDNLFFLSWLTKRIVTGVPYLTSVIAMGYNIHHCFICHPSDSTVSEDVGIEPWTVVTTALAVRRLNHSAGAWISSTTRLDLINSRLDLIHTLLDLIHTRPDLIHTRLDLIDIRLDLIHTLLDLIHTRLDLIDIRLDLIHFSDSSVFDCYRRG